ncbi:MAG: hypothetical protein KAT34_07975 [Candidatus Aminicenantes bacterium]|nr:hypothetical protein [Candidatus Aminicenantes bacterium]
MKQKSEILEKNGAGRVHKAVCPDPKITGSEEFSPIDKIGLKTKGYSGGRK